MDERRSKTKAEGDDEVLPAIIIISVGILLAIHLIYTGGLPRLFDNFL